MHASTRTAHAPDAAPAVSRSTARTLFAGSIGNVLEWFDWSVYSAFAIYFSTQIFPPGDGNAALLAAFAVFAIGFLMRPLGGWVIGAFSDRYGRRSALTLTIVMMAGSSWLIALLPTYATVGIVSPVLMTVFRMLQGLSVGGEYGAATTFLTESAPANRRGFYGSFLFFSIAVGLLLASGLASLMNHYLSRDALEAWGWRVPFFIGGCGSLVGFWMRRNVDETHAFRHANAAARRTQRSVVCVWRDHPRAILLLAGTSILPAFSFYLFVAYMPVYAVKHAGAAPSAAFAASTLSIVIFMIAQPLFGMLSDRFGRRPQLVVYALGYLLLLYPVIHAVGPSFARMLLVNCFGLLLYALYSAIAPALMAELFSTDVRGVGIGAAYNLVVALVGGTTPYLMSWLESVGHQDWFIGYVSIGALVTLIAFCCVPENGGAELG